MRNFSFARRLGAAAIAGSVITAGVVAPASAQESAGPKNIIYMIGDGMGYNHVAYNNLFETGQSKYLVDGEFSAEGPQEIEGESVQAYEDFNHLAMSTYSHGGTYDPEQAWATHDYVNEGIITDSAAASTAMATGAKVENGRIGVNNYGHKLESMSERAKKLGKAAGVVSSVPFSHATPAGFAAHNPDRNAYAEITNEMLDSDLDLVMGAGHPLYDDSNNLLDTPEYGYIDKEDFDRLSNGETDWNFFDTTEDFEQLANGQVEPDQKYWGTPQVASTLQQGRDGSGETPYSDPRNDVVDLATMTTGALNVLGQEEEGFSVMIEGGAIDWTGHANDSAREIEEMQDFNASVDAAIEWVDQNSNWDETLLIVTADHETGYLSGPDETEKWNAQQGEAGQLPEHEWYSGDHTNQLVPFFFKGAGSADLEAKVKGTDPVRGDYLDNTAVANLALQQWWHGTSDEDGDGDNGDDNTPAPDNGSSLSSSSSLLSGLAGAGIAAGLIGAILTLAQNLGIVRLDLSQIEKALRDLF
ncbi:alkaline phosphatase [Corynebacterium camporealensis]